MKAPRESAVGWACLGAGAALLPGAAAMLTRTLRPTLEAREYVRDIEGATGGAEANIQALAKLERTRDLSAALAHPLEDPSGGSG